MRQFLLARRDDDFAATFVRDAVFLTKAIHRFPTFRTQFGFQRTGLVVKAGVNDTAVVSRLMGAETRFGFEKDKTKVRLRIKERICHRYTDDSSANNCDVVRTIAHCGMDSNSNEARNNLAADDADYTDSIRVIRGIRS